MYAENDDALEFAKSEITVLMGRTVRDLLMIYSAASIIIGFIP